jgi:hypothetical protein
MLPIEALTVPVATGQVMGLYTSAVPAVSRQIAAIPGFPEVYKLGTAQYDGRPLPIGMATIKGPVLDPVTLGIYTQQTTAFTKVADMPGGGFAWFRRTGDPIGTRTNQLEEFVETYERDYLYFASKIKRQHLAQAYWQHKQYTVTRSYVPAMAADVYRLDFFDADTQTASNAAGGPTAYSLTAGGFDDYTLTPYPTGDNNDNHTLSWQPIFTQSVSAWGTQGARGEAWLRMEQIQIPSTGFAGDATAQINTLFPITSFTPEVDEAKRQWARRFAYPQDWPSQQRDFDTAVKRQGEIPALNCVPIPSFELNVGGLIPEADFRSGFTQFGDFCAMAWKPHETDDSSVWVLNRIRIPTPVQYPKIKPQDVGLSEWFQGERFFQSDISTQAVVAIDSNKTIGMGIIPGKTTGALQAWPNGGTAGTSPSYVQAHAKLKNVGQILREKQVRTNGGASGVRTVGYPSAEVDAAVAAGQFLQFGEAAPFGQVPCIGLTKGEAMANTPANVIVGGSFVKEAGAPPTLSQGIWLVQAVKVLETGIYTQTRYQISGPNDLQVQMQTELDQATVAAWANEFFGNPNKFIVVGEYRWQAADGTILLKQDIWGHADLTAAFNVVANFEQ